MKWLIIVMAAVLTLIIGARVLTNIEARPYPPLTCQLLGGSWDLWNGWTCG